MSLVSTFVQAVDNKFYKDPIIYGEDWYLCFDDDDPPEVVVMHRKNWTPAMMREHARKMLDARKMEFKILKQLCGGGTSRMFPPEYKKPYSARSFEVDLLAPICIPDFHRGAVSEPDGQCVFYAWSLTFPTRVIADLFRVKGKVNPMISGWMTNQEFFMMNDGEKRQHLRNRIVKQYEQMRGLDPDLFEQVFGTEIRINK